MGKGHIYKRWLSAGEPRYCMINDDITLSEEVMINFDITLSEKVIMNFDITLSEEMVGIFYQ